MLDLRDICKRYVTQSFTQVALDSVSLSFRDNEFVAILGPSGSGKTTMLNVIGGLDHFDSGDLLIDDISTKDFNDRDWDAYRNNRIGFVFQSYNLIPHQSILENVELALTLTGLLGRLRQENRLNPGGGPFYNFSLHENSMFCAAYLENGTPSYSTFLDTSPLSSSTYT